MQTASQDAKHLAFKVLESASGTDDQLVVHWNTAKTNIILVLTKENLTLIGISC